jgi:hypothetical protein
MAGMVVFNVPEIARVHSGSPVYEGTIHFEPREQGFPQAHRNVAHAPKSNKQMI